MSIFKTIKNAESSVANNNNKRTAVGGYTKIGQMTLNAIAVTALFVRDAGVMIDGTVGDVDSVKTKLISHEQDKVEAYKKDLKDLKKQLKKAKGKTTKSELKQDIVTCKRSIVYYEKKLSKAITL